MPFLRSPLLVEFQHGFTTRQGGRSEAPFDSLNLGGRVGDDPARVAENWALVERETGLSFARVSQVHGARAVRLDAPSPPVEEADAVITRRPGLAACVSVADCVPILLADPGSGAVAAVHAGWRGTLARVAAEAVRALAAEAGGAPERLLAVIGPSIGPCCYEVSPDLAARFGAEIGPEVVRGGPAPALDLWAANAAVLRAAGVRPDRIETLCRCTSCERGLLFSHRRDAGRTGRQIAFIAPRPPTRGGGFLDGNRGSPRIFRVLTLSPRDAAAAVLLLAACAGGGDPAKRDLEALRAEIHALRKDNEDLSRKVDALSGRVEVISTRLARPAQPAPREETAAPLVPPDLEVVRVEPPKGGRTPPSIPTAVPIAEPEPERLDALSRRSGRDLGQDADEELRRARKRTGAAQAHALEDFAGRYPRHPSADNALVEAAAAYAEAGKGDAACELARRCARDYPAGDSLSDALERLAWCEARRGGADAERKLLERLVNEFPRTPAAERAGLRLATISGRSGDAPAGPARSSP